MYGTCKLIRIYYRLLRLYMTRQNGANIPALSVVYIYTHTLVEGARALPGVGSLKQLGC